jgi:YD repeat-containing protein
MAYKLTGTYVAHCDCAQICPCAVDEAPTGRDGTCHGLIVANIDAGKLDGTDVSGTTVALAYNAPGKLSAGNLNMGLVVDEAASDEQVSALERIFKGEEGGMFGEFGALTSKWLGVERASIAFSDGDEPSAKIGNTDVTFQAYRDPEGNKTVARNAPFGLAPEFTLGKSAGKSGLFGESFDANYGEAAKFEWAG